MVHMDGDSRGVPGGLVDCRHLRNQMDILVGGSVSPTHRPDMSEFPGEKTTHTWKDNPIERSGSVRRIFEDN